MKFFVIILLSILSAHVFAQTKENPLKMGDPAPVFSLPDLQNNYIFLRDYSGEKLRKPWKNKTKYVEVYDFLYAENNGLLKFSSDWAYNI